MFSIFQNYPQLLVSLSEKKDGDMKIDPANLNNKQIKLNRKNYFSQLGIKKEQTVVAGLIHKTRVAIIKKEDQNKIIPKTDTLVTQEKNIFLTLTVADCLPIFLYDPQKEVVGLIHAGWQGLKNRIIKKTIHKLQKEFGSKAQNILVAVGPAIDVNNYEVGRELVVYFQRYAKSAIMNQMGKKYLDLKKIAQIQLKEAGIKKENMEISLENTYDKNGKYFSYRRDKPLKVEAMVAVLGMKKKKLINL